MTQTIEIAPDALEDDPRQKADQRKGNIRKRQATRAIARHAEATGQHIIRKRAPAKPQSNQVKTANELLIKYKDPRAVLLELAAKDTSQLAEQLGCTPLEAMQERRHAAVAVLPYVVNKMPVQMHLQHAKAIHVTFQSWEGEAEQHAKDITQATIMDLASDDL